MQTHRITVKVESPGDVITSVLDVTADQAVSSDITIASDASAYEVDFTLTRSKCSSLVIACDQAVTVKTNTSGGVDTLNVTPTAPVVWYSGNGVALTTILSADVTKLYVTNVSSPATAATLKIRALVDITPA